jgi:hypothetical protein
MSDGSRFVLVRTNGFNNNQISWRNVQPRQPHRTLDEWHLLFLVSISQLGISPLETGIGTAFWGFIGTGTGYVDTHWVGGGIIGETS